MCLAIPAKVTAISENGEMATISLDGVQKEVSLALVEEVQIGDYVLVHVGYALNRLSPEEAERTLQIFAEAGMLQEGPA
jgi:hydrogenase expression/formation protein HypC